MPGDTERDRARQAALADQSFAELGDNLPPALFRFFQGCCGGGFTQDEALALTREYLRALLAGEAPKR